MTEDDPLVRAAIDAAVAPMKARQQRDQAMRDLKMKRGWTLEKIHDHLRDEAVRRGLTDKEIKGLGISYDNVRRACGPTR